MKPVSIKLQNCYTGMGIEENPIICWKYADTDAGQKQRAFRICLWEKDMLVYDSGWTETAVQNNCRIPLKLKRHQSYTVQVEAENEQGKQEKGERFVFVSGIGTAWRGKWISNGSEKPFYAGKSINIKKKLRSAYVSCAGAGQYQLLVNDKLPDDSRLNGSWTDFDKRIHYRTFDITSQLHVGDNFLTVEVGNGWYCAPEDDGRHFYTREMGYEPFGKQLALIAELTLEYEDGEREIVGTDSSWLTKKSETVYTNVYGSEDYDARMENAEWEGRAQILNDENRPQGNLVPMCYPPVVVKGIYAGKKIRVYEDGSVLYDLGQNMSGMFRVTVSGRKGTRIRIFPTEKLDARQNPWSTVNTWCTYTLKGNGRESWKPKFTYGAGRYLWISAEKGEDLPQIHEVSAEFLSSAAEDVGEFYCSDYRYMQIHDLVLRAIESNLHHVHTDCPTIERLGWQEPNHLMAPSVFYTKNAETLWEKFARDQRDSQYASGETDKDKGKFPHEYGEGLLPAIAPRYAKFLYDGGEGSFWDIVPWGSSLLLGAWEVYRFTGNCKLLKENFEAGKNYVDYLYDKYCRYPEIYEKSEDTHFLCHGLGDWGIEQNRGESRENIETAYLYRDCRILEETAELLGREEEHSYYRKIAERILKEYNDTLLRWNPQTGEWAYDSYDKTGFCPTQTAQAIPLQFGMVPLEKKVSVERSFLLACDEKKLRTGEIGLPYILRTLGDLKQADLVQKMIFQEYHPSYYRFIEKGETTLPEFWRDDARSRNHDMMGAILEWMYRYMAGISSEDGYRTIRIEPQLPQGTECLKCCYTAITGDVMVHIIKRAESMQVKVRIPVNTVGTIAAEGKEITIEGGKIYQITVPCSSSGNRQTIVR